jgi:hypothetical protein
MKTIELKVVKVWSGWKNFRTPDDIDIELILPGEKILFDASLQELLNFLKDLNNKQKIEVWMGTFNVFKINREEDELLVEINEGDLTVRVHYKDFVDELTSAIQKIIEIKDEKDPSSNLKEKYLKEFENYL